MDNRKLQLSLFHLDIIATELANIMIRLNEGINLPHELFIPINKFIIIRTCAFYDELEYHFLKDAKSDEIRYIKLERIYDYMVSKWNTYFPDLYDLRNRALAHSFRVKEDNKYYSMFDRQVAFAFPKSGAEISLNINMIDMFLAGLKVLYPEITAIMGEDLQYPEEKAGAGIIDENNFQDVMSAIAYEMKRIVNENL